MPPDELSEVRERAEKLEADRSLMPATFTMSVLAVILAAVSILSHRAHTREIIKQTEAADQWSFYQAKNLRRHNYELFAELMQVSDFRNKDLAAKLQEKYKKQADRYDREKEEAMKEAQRLQGEVNFEERRADRFDFAEALMEIALVITSITLLTRQKSYWYIGLGFGGVGLIVAGSGLLIH